MPPTVPDDARLKKLAEIHDTLAGFFEKCTLTDPDAEHSVRRNRDVAAACRAVIAARALCADIDGPDKGPWYGNEVAIWFRAILGAPAPDARGGNDG